LSGAAVARDDGSDPADEISGFYLVDDCRVYAGEAEAAVDYFNRCLMRWSGDGDEITVIGDKCTLIVNTCAYKIKMQVSPIFHSFGPLSIPALISTPPLLYPDFHHQDF
jgi:hypothetical protein